MNNSEVTGADHGEAVFYPALTFDPDEFMAYVEGCDLTDEQAAQLLRAVWEIAVAFIDLGLSLNPHASPANFAVDGLGGTAALASGESGPMINCSDIFSAIANQRIDGPPSSAPAKQEDS